MFLFGSKDGLIRALLDRARLDEVEALQQLEPASGGLSGCVETLWTWLSSDAHRPLLLLWVESYSRSLLDEDGPWAGFAQATVTGWLDRLAQCQCVEDRSSASGAAERTLALAVLRGALLDLLATSDLARSSAAVLHYTAQLRQPDRVNDR